MQPARMSKPSLIPGCMGGRVSTRLRLSILRRWRLRQGKRTHRERCQPRRRKKFRIRSARHPKFQASCHLKFSWQAPKHSPCLALMRYSEKSTHTSITEMQSQRVGDLRTREPGSLFAFNVLHAYYLLLPVYTQVRLMPARQA